MSPQCPGSRHGSSTCLQGHSTKVGAQPPIIRQRILLSLVLHICLKELLSVCFQGDLASLTVLRACNRRCY